MDLKNICLTIAIIGLDAYALQYTRCYNTDQCVMRMPL